MSKSKYTNKQAERITDALMHNSFINGHEYDDVYELVRNYLNHDKLQNPSTEELYPSAGKRYRRYKGINLGKYEKRS